LKEKKGIRKEKKEIRSRAISLAQSKLGSKMGSISGSRATSKMGSLSASRATSRMGSRASSPPPGEQDDFNFEAALMKKLKRGLISRQQFDQQTGDGDL
jgi:hypothetical protein